MPLINLMKFFIVFLLAAAFIYLTSSSQCGCDEKYQEKNCTDLSNGCEWISGSCKQKQCSEQKTKDKCVSFEHQGYGDSISCHWTGKECKEIHSCDDMTFEATPTKDDCPNCILNANDKKCDSIPKFGCGDLNMTSCIIALMMQGMGGSISTSATSTSATSASASGASTSSFSFSTFKTTNKCWIDKNFNCHDINDGTSCSDLLSEPFCNVLSRKCAWVASACKEKACADAKNENECASYMDNSPLSSNCEWQDGACKVISQDPSCSDLKTKIKCQREGCIYSDSKCSDFTCETTKVISTTDPITIRQDSNGNVKICRAAGTYYKEISVSDLTQNECYVDGGSYYTWNNKECVKCSDKSASKVLALISVIAALLV